MNSVKAHRRTLHQIPEIANQEFLSKQYILEVLTKCNCEIIEVLETGVMAYFQKGCNQTVAFRADMDGLPVQEVSDLPYRSKHEGRMHACGHDAHMAILLGFAEELSQMNEDEFQNNILLIFQPAEETIGGAKRICETGVFKKTNTIAIFGIHMHPILAKGYVGSKSGPFMASASEVDVIVSGKSSHCAEAHLGVDPIEIAAQLLLQFYEIERKLNQQEKMCVFKFGYFQAGTVRNILPQQAILKGSARAFNEKHFAELVENAQLRCQEMSENYGCEIEFNYNEGYPPLINDDNLFRYVSNQISDFVTFEQPFNIAEDFSFYCKEIPGCFLYLGTGKNIALHNCAFDIDEDVLQVGVDTYLRLMNYPK